MRHALALALAVGLLCFASSSSAPLSAAEELYAAAGQVPIGGAARFDYLAVDSLAKRLYVTHGTEVVVIDLTTQKIVGRIADTNGVHGIAFADGRGFVTAGAENKVAIVDLKTLQTVMKVDTGANPDAIVYEPARKEIYSLNHTEKSVTVIDGDGHITIIRVGPGDKMTVAQTLETSRGARTMTLDPATHKIYTAAATFNPPAAAGERPVPVPDTFRVLVYAPTK